MKRIFLSLILLFGASLASASAWPPTREDWMETPQYVYKSTWMTLLIPSTFSAIISSYPCIVHAVYVGSATGSSQIDLFDQRSSTNRATTPVMFTINNQTAIQYPSLDLFFSSGLVAIPRGSANPNNLIIYREKW